MSLENGMANTLYLGRTSSIRQINAQAETNIQIALKVRTNKTLVLKKRKEKT